MRKNVLNYLLSVKKKKGAVYIVLIDPDKNSENNLEEKISKINNSGVDAIFVGGSLILDNNCEKRVELIKSISLTYYLICVTYIIFILKSSFNSSLPWLNSLTNQKSPPCRLMG